jgi:CRISPR system Cascade subunit CasD
MATLLLRLAGPLQAWGTTSRFDERDTQLEPSKSGVIGLVCAALGRDRATPVDDLAAFRFGVRVDREGSLLRDFQTATGVLAATGKRDDERTVVSPRYYLADAVFLVGLQGPDRSVLDKIDAAIRSPRWPLALGRKACTPTQPVFLPGGLVDADLEQALRQFPRVAAPSRDGTERGCRLLLEHADEGSVRYDQPIGAFADRQFGPRFVRSEVVDVFE